MSTGKFHGLTAATTPIGSWTTMIRLFVVRSWVDGGTAPAWRSTSSDARRKWSTVNSSISSRDSRIVLPTSIEIIRAISSLRSMQSVERPAADLHPLQHRGGAPGREGGLGRRDRRIDLCRRRCLHGSDELAGRRAVDVDPLAVPVDPLAADECAGGCRHNRHVVLLSLYDLGRSFSGSYAGWVVTRAPSPAISTCRPTSISAASSTASATGRPTVRRRTGASHLADGAAGRAHLCAGRRRLVPVHHQGGHPPRQSPGGAPDQRVTAAEGRLGQPHHAVEAELERIAGTGLEVDAEQDQPGLAPQGLHRPHAVGPHAPGADDGVQQPRGVRRLGVQLVAQLAGVAAARDRDRHASDQHRLGQEPVVAQPAELAAGERLQHRA